MAIDPAIVSHRLYWLGCGYAINQLKKKTPGSLIAHKEKLREDLSRGNSIDFVLFLFFLSLFLALRIFCLFVFVRKIGMFPL